MSTKLFPLGAFPGSQCTGLLPATPPICLSLWWEQRNNRSESTTGGSPPTHTSAGPPVAEKALLFWRDVYSVWNVSAIQRGDSFKLPRRRFRECVLHLRSFPFCKTFKLTGPGSQSPDPDRHLQPTLRNFLGSRTGLDLLIYSQSNSARYTKPLVLFCLSHGVATGSVKLLPAN